LKLEYGYAVNPYDPQFAEKIAAKEKEYSKIAKEEKKKSKAGKEHPYIMYTILEDFFAPSLLLGPILSTTHFFTQIMTLN
jgi:hypothetical protein